MNKTLLTVIAVVAIVAVVSVAVYSGMNMTTTSSNGQTTTTTTAADGFAAIDDQLSELETYLNEEELNGDFGTGDIAGDW